ncbi:hypothetical protein O0L34_g8001 [Tuta absoluta]|nr:hypothetical protein O0L34_g8001 [Tuta absoluta]
MAPRTLTCAGCIKEFKRNNYITCSICKKVLCIDGCSNVSRKRYTLMESGKKAFWKCDNCAKARSSTPNTTELKALNTCAGPSLPIDPKLQLLLPQSLAEEQGLAKIDFNAPTSNTPTLQHSPIDSNNTSCSSASTAMAISTLRDDDYIEQDHYEINIPTKNSFESLDSDVTLNDKSDGSTIHLRNQSCPNLSTSNNNSLLAKSKKRIIELENRLKLSDELLNQYLIENNILKEEIKLKDKRIARLTQLCSLTPKTKENKKRECLNRSTLNSSAGNEVKVNLTSKINRNKTVMPAVDQQETTIEKIPSTKSTAIVPERESFKDSVDSISLNPILQERN